MHLSQITSPGAVGSAAPAAKEGGGGQSKALHIWIEGGNSGPVEVIFLPSMFLPPIQMQVSKEAPHKSVQWTRKA